MPEVIVIQPYDARWPEDFEIIRARLAAALGDTALRIEHVGSTSVPGLAAKPVIDLDIVIARETDLPRAISKLQVIGYRYEGEKGIPGRHAFGAPAGLPVHHLYVCALGNRELKRHLAFRDYLRANPLEAEKYAELKYNLARQFGSDRDGYSEAKTTFVEAALIRQHDTHFQIR